MAFALTRGFRTGPRSCSHIARRACRAACRRSDCRSRNFAFASSTCSRCCNRARQRNDRSSSSISTRRVSRTVGQWPWPRTRVADLINRLTQMGALVIAFDIVFAEPDRMSPGVAADVFRDLDDATKSKLRALPSNDAVFAEALRNSHVVLGESGLPFAVAQPEGAKPAGRHCDHGRRCTAISAELPWSAPQVSRSSSRRAAGAACSPSAPSAMASCGACPL